MKGLRLGIGLSGSVGETNLLLLEGDEQSGVDKLLLEGDGQSGSDVLELEGTP